MTKNISSDLVVKYAINWMEDIAEEFNYMNYKGKFGLCYDSEEPIECTDIYDLLKDYTKDLVNSRVEVNWNGYFKDATIVAIDEDGEVKDTKNFKNIALGVEVNKETKDVARKLNNVLFADDEYDDLDDGFNNLLADQQFFVIWQNSFSNDWLDEFKKELYKK